MAKKRVWISRTKIVFETDQDFGMFLERVRKSVPADRMKEVLENGQATQKMNLDLYTQDSVIENLWAVNDVEDKDVKIG